MEDTKPLVSFIIPAHNVPPAMLRKCIESILALSLRAFEREIIIIDYSSSDCPLLDGLGELADETIYIRQRNADVSVARNTGMQMATGRFMQFVGGDSRLIKAPYEHVLDHLRYGQSDMVLFDYSKTADAPLLYDDQGPMTGSEMLRCENIRGSAWGYVFSRSIAGSLRFTPGMNYGEDKEFTPQLMLRAENVVRTTAKAYFYRQKPPTANGTQSIRSHIRRLEDSRSVIMRLKKIAVRLPAADKPAMQRYVALLTMDYIYNIIVTTGSSHYLERKIGELGKAGLFPLPDRNYTTKYTWFRRMANSRAGRAVLLKSLPVMEGER